MPAVWSQRVARREASISTGRVTKEKSVVSAKRATPKAMMPGKASMSNMPASNTHCTQLEAKETMGTSAERICNGP